MIEIDTARYAKVTRNRALQILEGADLKPDKFTAHRDRTFTAKYLRSRQSLFNTQRYEERMEVVGDKSVAIFKRPSTRMDRGPYITLKFAVAALDRLGLEMESHSPKATVPAPEKKETPRPAVVELSPRKQTNGHPTGDIALIHRLIGVSRDMKQLTHYAHDLAEKKAASSESDHHHMLVTLEEMKKHVEELAQGLQKLVSQQASA